MKKAQPFLWFNSEPSSKVTPLTPPNIVVPPTDNARIGFPTRIFMNNRLSYLKENTVNPRD